MKHFALLLGSLTTLAATAMSGSLGAAETDWVSLFDGRTLRGWQAAENPATFTVVNGAIVADGPRAHLFYTGENGRADFKNFEFQAEVMTRPGANSGIFFHTRFQEKDFPTQGFEAQINNSQPAHGGYLENKKTGSLYGLRNVYKALVPDNQWFTLHLTVRGRRIQIRVNEVLLVDYVEPEPRVLDEKRPGRRVSHGTFALQGHDPESKVFFRNLRVKRLPDELNEPPPVVRFDAVDQQILRLGIDNYPLVDLHTHLKGGLTLSETLEHMRRTGINHGIAINGGIGFPVTNDAAIEAFRRQMEGQPVFIGMQAEGREWPRLFSKEALAKFDYVFTDAMTINDQAGRRSRLWIKEEVAVPDKEAFMELLVSNIVNILNHEQIDIYVNPTYLPDVLAAEYARLWTSERMQRVIDAAVKNRIAIEINSRFKIPSAEFIKRARKAGVKFTLGTNNGDRDLGRLEYALQMIQECELSWNDFWLPRTAQGVGLQ